MCSACHQQRRRMYLPALSRNHPHTAIIPFRTQSKHHSRGKLSSYHNYQSVEERLGRGSEGQWPSPTPLPPLDYDQNAHFSPGRAERRKKYVWYRHPSRSRIAEKRPSMIRGDERKQVLHICAPLLLLYKPTNNTAVGCLRTTFEVPHKLKLTKSSTHYEQVVNWCAYTPSSEGAPGYSVPCIMFVDWYSLCQHIALATIELLPMKISPSLTNLS